MGEFDKDLHVGLPVAAAGTIEVGNIVQIGTQAYIVTKVGGSAFDCRPNWERCPERIGDLQCDALLDPYAQPHRTHYNHRDGRRIAWTVDP